MLPSIIFFKGFVVVIALLFFVLISDDYFDLRPEFAVVNFFILCGAIVFLLCGCHKNDKVENAVKVADIAIDTENKKAEELFVEAKKYIKSAKYELATTNLNQIEENYPYSKRVKDANVLTVYLAFIQGKYAEIGPIVEFYATVYPFDNNLAYLNYIKALSNYRQIKSYKRNYDHLLRTKQSMDFVIVNYPDSKYAADLKSKLEDLKKYIQMYDLDVAVFYQNKLDCIAAIKRYSMVIKGSNDAKVIDFAVKNKQICLEYLGFE